MIYIEIDFFDFINFNRFLELGTHLGVNYINILGANFLYERRLGSFFYIHLTREKLPKQRL